MKRTSGQAIDAGLPLPHRSGPIEAPKTPDARGLPRLPLPHRSGPIEARSRPTRAAGAVFRSLTGAAPLKPAPPAARRARGQVFRSLTGAAPLKHAATVFSGLTAESSAPSPERPH